MYVTEDWNLNNFQIEGLKLWNDPNEDVQAPKSSK
jgi:hypothetical protein